MAKHTIEELQQWQALPLSIKVMMTKDRIRNWVNEFGIDGVYVSFSGGKDSTVLLHIAREMYPNMKAVFVDTGLEYPEIRDFVKTFENVDWVRPKMTFKQVVEKYGFPFISKEVSETVDYARKYVKSLDGGGKVKGCAKMADLLAVDRRSEKDNDAYADLKRGIIPKPNQRYQILVGELKHKEKGVETNEFSKMYDKSRYKFFLGAPFDISARCCSVMKKQPVAKYAKDTGRKPMTAQMASESKLRTQQWLRNGCNGFEMNKPISNPMAFWTEQDVLLYIKLNSLPIASVYGDIVIDYDGEGQVEGQMDISQLGSEFGLFDQENRLLKTTGCERTGCMFCGYGCHLEASPNRFEMMKKTHPKQYDYIMRPKEEGGLNYRAVIDWINEHGDMDIKY